MATCVGQQLLSEWCPCWPSALAPRHRSRKTLLSPADGTRRASRWCRRSKPRPISVRSTPSGHRFASRQRRRVFAADDRFASLVEALSETAAFAVTLETLSAQEIAAVPDDEWDFAKYTQAVARDQCAQLARVVDGGREGS